MKDSPHVFTDFGRKKMEQETFVASDPSNWRTLSISSSSIPIFSENLQDAHLCARYHGFDDKKGCSSPGKWGLWKGGCSEQFLFVGREDVETLCYFHVMIFPSPGKHMRLTHHDDCLLSLSRGYAISATRPESM